MRNVKAPRMVILCGLLLLAADCVLAQDWPQWRGPNRDNKVVGFAVPAAWPKTLTKKWRVSVGVGESSPVMVGDKIYVFGREGGDEVTRCLDAATGKEVWKDKNPAKAPTGGASGHPGPRSTPAVGDGKICTFGVQGVVSCFDAAIGKLVWRKNTTPPMFFTASSPIVVDGKCIVFGAALTAYDLTTGAEKWKWSGGTPYGSPVLMTADGVKQIVTPAAGALAGVGLADGKLLWQIKFGPGGGDYTTNCSTPIVDGQKVFYSGAAKGKGSGGTVALKIEKNGDAFTATELWKKTEAADKWHSPLLKDDLLYGVSSGSLQIFCWDAKTGAERWKDTARRGQCGCILDAGPVLLELSTDKQLVVFEPSDKKFTQVAKYAVADGEPWSVPIVAGNRVFVKDLGGSGSLTLWMIE